MAEDRTDRSPYPFPLPADLFDETLDQKDDDGGVSSFAVFGHFLRHARWILGLPLIAFVVVALYMGSKEHDYIARSKFLPASADFSGRDTGVFSQLSRLMNRGGGGGPGSLFYSFLIPSTAFLRDAARTEFEFTRLTEEGQEERVQGTLAEIYGAPSSNEEAELRTSLSIMRGMVSADRENGTDFVVVSVEAPWKGLAVAVNNRILEMVNQFNLEQRRSQAAAEREFIEARMAEAKAELEAAEAAFVQFVETNQQYQQSPRLQFEALRLQNQVDLKRNLYSQLAQSYEEARISEVRNTPVVTIVERPSETVYRPKGGNDPFRFGLMAAVVVLLLTLGFFGARAFFSRQREEHPDDYEEFRQLALSALPGRVRDRLLGRNGGEEAPALPGAGAGDEAATGATGTDEPARAKSAAGETS